MADYCPRCGTTVTGHYTVCVGCGGAVGDAAPPVVAPWIAPPSHATPARVRFAWIAAVLLLAGLGLAFGLWRLATRHSGIDAPPSAQTQSRKGSVSAAGLGVDLYPGATEQQRGTRKTRNGSAISATLTTPDSLERVIDFYETRLGTASIVFHNQTSAVLELNSDDKKNSVMVTISAETGGRTKIGILHSKVS